MDIILRANASALLITPQSLPSPARGMSNDAFAALSKAEAKKRLVQSDAGKMLASPKIKASEHDKAEVKARIEEIKKRLNIIKNLFSNDPKGMAKALAQVFKELKAALKAYKADSDDELGMSDELAAEATAPQAAAPDDAKDKTDAAPADTSATNAQPAEAAPAETTTATTDPDGAAKAEAATTPAATTSDPTAASTGSDLYKAADQMFRKTIGEDDLDFIKTIKGLVQAIEDKLLTPARIQMKAQKSDKDTDEAFKEVDKQLAELKKEMDDETRDIKQAVPDAGTYVNLAA